MYAYQVVHQCGQVLAHEEKDTFLEPFFIGGRMCPQCGKEISKWPDYWWRRTDIHLVAVKRVVEKRLLGLIPVYKWVPIKESGHE